MEKTTIQINVETLDRLKDIKSSERESYNEIVNKLIDNYEEESLTKEEIDEIQKSLEDLKNGRVYSIEEVAKELGISLD